jgi:hypothetical protein
MRRLWPTPPSLQAVAIIATTCAALLKRYYLDQKQKERDRREKDAQRIAREKGPQYARR